MTDGTSNIHISHRGLRRGAGRRRDGRVTAAWRVRDAANTITTPVTDGIAHRVMDKEIILLC